VVADGSEHFPLEIGGLMSERSLPEVVAGCRRIHAAVRRIGGDDSLLMRLSFLALPVVPALRLTNRGLVDVAAFDFVPVLV
jgi:adenine deaminase